jgi:tRNA-Thr(GGU) m(6)t(6)A37 methyltransferase TsaA
MTEAAITYTPIGVIRTDHLIAEKTPIQPACADGCQGRAEIFPEFAEGMRDLEDFSHVYLIYHFHRCGPTKLLVKPFLQDVERGVFATRAPCRPNAIGLSVVELVRREGNVLHINNVDILDGTPLLDIKPYTARFDRIEITRNGWQDEVDEETARQRGRRGHAG